MFVDRVEIEVAAGAGGAGSVSFRREKYVPKGGPDGGDGGRGGSVVFIVDRNVKTLLDFRHRPFYRAEAGDRGQGANKTGSDGRDLRILIPPGTVVRDAESGEVVADLTISGSEWIAAKGGRGGRGNARFATATRQAPRHAEPGTEGERRRLELTLKLIADIGLVGLPNAGKSTLLSRITRANPKVGAYPFTTLSPNLGIAALDDERQIVFADLPGLIEGAHEGKGLGHEFLRHIERTQVLVFLVEAGSEDPERDLEILEGELEQYAGDLRSKPSLVALSKIDLVDEVEAERLRKRLEARGTEAISLSSVTGAGLDRLLRRSWELLEASHGG
jgi:GTPase